jgi:hypothetical protein
MLTFQPLLDANTAKAEQKRNELIESYRIAYARALANHEFIAAGVLRFRLSTLERRQNAAVHVHA